MPDVVTVARTPTEPGIRVFDQRRTVEIGNLGQTRRGIARLIQEGAIRRTDRAWRETGDEGGIGKRSASSTRRYASLGPSGVAISCANWRGT
jgi:hypothetical protein